MQVGLELLALRDVLDHALEVSDAAGFVQDRARIFGNPHDRAIFAIDFRFKAAHGAMRLHILNKLVTTIGIDVELVVDGREALDQILGRVVPVHFRQRRVDVEILSAGCGLENALDGILENAAVHLLGMNFGHKSLGLGVCAIHKRLY